MKKHLLPALLSLLLVLNLCGPARAATPPPATGRPLAEALNPDGTLKKGLNGSFDAHAFRMQTAPDGRPVFRPVGTKGAGDERWADGFGLPNGTDGVVKAVLRVGNDVYVGGSFTAVGNVPASGIAKWNGTTWSRFDAGITSGVAMTTVNALAVAANGDLYIGGAFTLAGGIVVNSVAKWNGTAWGALGANGMGYGPVYALTVASNGDLYAGGGFTQAGGVTANRIAKWNGTAWSSLGTGTANGVNGAVNAMVVTGSGDLYVGGAFDQAGAVAVRNVAMWNGSFWTPLGLGTANGVNGAVNAMVVTGNGDLYLGGAFIQAGVAVANRIAKWDGTAWSSLNTGTANGLTGIVYALAAAGNGDVYAGGSFTLAGGAAASNVAKWNGTAWSSLGTGAAIGVGGLVNALAVAGNGEVYVGGNFVQAGGVVANHVANWNGTAWSTLNTSPGNGVNGSINALAMTSSGQVYVGGNFGQAGGVLASNVAKWNGTAWSSLGTGTDNGVGGPVYALAVASNGDLYVGGHFTQAGGAGTNYVAKWNGTAWSSLGDIAGGSTGSGSTVYALAVASNGDVYAGGDFIGAGGVAAIHVARWDGTDWSSLGTGTTGGGIVYALAVAGNSDVYVGGRFTQAGGVAANNVAKWNGTAWSSLGTGTANGVSYFVYALAVASNGDLYVGGEIGQAGGASANLVARWNGTAWNAIGTLLGNGMPAVRSLALAANGDVYAGGNFTQAGGLATNVARWNGNTWSSFGTGTNERVAGLAVGTTGQLYAGGFFTATGDGSKVMTRFAIYDPAAPLATRATTATPAAELYPNPAHGTATLRLPAGAPRQPLTLTDALGRVVRRYPAPAAAEAELDLRGLPAGTYVVRCGPLSQRLVVE
jgi:hypothetical protein